MTVAELHYDFDIKIDKVSTAAKQDFNRAEKDWLLNEGVKVILKKYYTGNNMSKTAFETTQKRADDLSSLVIKYPLQPELTPSNVPNTSIYEVRLEDLNFPYWFFIRGTATLMKPVTPFTCIGEASLKLVSHDDLNYALVDPFTKTNLSEILFNFGRSTNASSTDFNKSSIFLYAGDYVVHSVKIEYIKQPAKINFGGYVYIDGITYPPQQCDLPDHMHSEVVDLAVQIASGIIESPEYVQLKTQKVFTNE